MNCSILNFSQIRLTKLLQHLHLPYVEKSASLILSVFDHTLYKGGFIWTEYHTTYKVGQCEYNHIFIFRTLT